MSHENNGPHRASNDGWHLDKRVPIALLLGLLAQAAVAVWWASGKDALDNYQNEQIAEVKASQSKIADVMAQLLERTARLEENSDRTVEMLREIKDAQRGSRR